MAEAWTEANATAMAIIDVLMKLFICNSLGLLNVLLDPCKGGAECYVTPPVFMAISLHAYYNNPRKSEK